MVQVAIVKVLIVLVQVQVAPLRKPPCAVARPPLASPRVGGGVAQFQQDALEGHNLLR